MRQWCLIPVLACPVASLRDFWHPAPDTAGAKGNGAARHGGPGTGAKKDVVLFIIDDLGAEALSPFVASRTNASFEAHTPNINALATRSLVLKKHYAPQALCSPSRVSLLTGRRPDSTRVLDLHAYFRDHGNFTTLPQWFKQQGYWSIGMGKIFQRGRGSGAGRHDHLQDDACCSWSQEWGYYQPPNRSFWQSFKQSWIAVPNALQEAHPLPDTEIARHAVQTLRLLGSARAQGDSRPFFLAVGLDRPHLPWVVSSEYLDFYPSPLKGFAPDASSQLVASSVELDGFKDQRGYRQQPRPDRVVDDMRRAYYASVTETDARIGEILAELDGNVLLKNAVVVLTADHGFELGQRGMWGKNAATESLLRVPGMLRVPGVTDGGLVSHALTEHVDLFPTLVELATGISLPRCLEGATSMAADSCTEGTSIVPLLRDPLESSKAAVFSQQPEMSWLLGWRPPQSVPMLYSVVTRVGGHEYRYSEWATYSTAERPGLPSWQTSADCPMRSQLYNRSTDPSERHNLCSGDRPATAAVQSVQRVLAARLRGGPDRALAPLV